MTYDTKIDKNGFEKGLKGLQSSVKNGGTKIKNIVSALGITKLVSTAISTINNSIDGAVSRIDTLNNFPKVMSNLGIKSEESSKAINKLSDGLQGIPTTLDDAALAVQRFTSKNGDVNKSVDLFLAVNNALLAGGASADIQSSAMEQLSQAYAKGKPDMIEWRSIQTAMPAQLKQISKAILGNKDSLDKYLKKAKEYQKANPLSSTAKELIEQLEGVKKGSGDMSTALGTALRTGVISMDDFMGVIVKMNQEGSGEFKSFEEQAKNSTGGINTSITNAKTAITRGVANIIKAFDEMLKDNGLGGLSEIINKIGKTAESMLKKVASAIPKVVSKVKDIYKWIVKNQTGLKALIKVVASVTAGYLAYKAVLVAINGIQIAKNITGTVSAFISLIPAIKSAKDAMLLLNMAFNVNPIGLVVAGVTALTTAFIAFSTTQGSVKKSMNSIVDGFKEFYDGINNATSHLDSFNSTLFASSEEQQKLQEDMDNVQKGITEICKKASDERRDYTQKEIKQLDEYFQKLRELKNRELEIQQSISNAITQQAQQEAQSFQGTLAEYKVKSEEMIKTAQEQKDATIKIIEEGTIQQIALLNQRYKTEEERQSEAYLNEYNSIIEQKQQKIDLANEEVAKVTEAYAKGYDERAKLEQGWYTILKDGNTKAEEENTRHQNRMNEINENGNLLESDKQRYREYEHENHKNAIGRIWREMYDNMSEEETKELGSWLARKSQVELYGGKISDENQKMVDTILKSYDDMPDDAKKKMQETMAGMFKGMEEKEPSLFAKASGIADGILSRLKKSFDIHSPSKKTKEIFKNVMKGAELGLEDEKDSLMKQIDNISESVIRKMQNAVAVETGSINAKVALQANANQPIVIARDHTITIENTQQFYSKNSTPYEEQKQAKQQLRRLAYGL